MKILQVTSPREFEILDVPVPEPGPDEVLMRITAVTTCPQWDLHLRHNEPMFVGHAFHYPFTPGRPGHEAVGRIEAVGKGVAGLKAGDPRVRLGAIAARGITAAMRNTSRLTAARVIRVPGEIARRGAGSTRTGDVRRRLLPDAARYGRNPGPLFRRLRAWAGPGWWRCRWPEPRAPGKCTGSTSFPTAGQWPSVSARPVATTRGPTCRGNSRCGRSGQNSSRPWTASAPGRRVEFLMDRTQDALALFGVQREDYTFSPRHYRGLRLCGYKGHSRESAEYALDLIRRGKLDLAALVTHRLAARTLR